MHLDLGRVMLGAEAMTKVRRWTFFSIAFVFTSTEQAKDTIRPAEEMHGKNEQKISRTWGF